MGLDPARVRALAAECGLAVAAVGPAEPDDALATLLERRVRAGHLRGLEWYTVERARVAADPRNLQATVRSVISVGIPYWSDDVDPPRDGEPRGRIARYAWGRDYHRTLRARLEALHRRLEGEVGRPIEARFLSDTARIVDRAAAARAGMGWYGKNTMILVPRHGSWVMLGELLVDLEIDRDRPLRSRCGQCRACRDACPTGALVDDYVLDAPRCLSYITIEHRGPIPRDLRPRLGNWVFGCDVCQDVCPYTAAARPSDEPDFRPESIEHAFPSLRWLLRMTEAEFREIYRGTAVLRAKRPGLARNAAVALGNVGTPVDLALLEEVVVGHDAPLVRGHAAWAMARIDRASSTPFLLRRLAPEPDAGARAEIVDALNGLSLPSGLDDAESAVTHASCTIPGRPCS